MLGFNGSIALSLLQRINRQGAPEPRDPDRTHRATVLHLAKRLETPYIEVGLGSLWRGAPRIADVVDIRYSYEHFAIMIYEVKVSRADFLQEIRSHKYKDSLPFCERFYFATLPDVAFAEEIPRTCGWFVLDGNAWIQKLKAQRRKIEYPRDFLLALIFKKKRDTYG